jgi:hypothetical protein
LSQVVTAGIVAEKRRIDLVNAGAAECVEANRLTQILMADT